MIFVRLLKEQMGEDPLDEHIDLVAELLDRHTESDTSKFENIRCVMRLSDGTDQRIDNDITRYVDENLSLYNFDDTIDPDHFIVALHAKSTVGHQHVQKMVDDIRRHPCYRGRMMDISILGVVTDEPHCIPCAKKNFERGK